ncbi:uncharacterized protein [Anabrus simplex]|uniref:uncharacterized protein isoform X2 n=1 Tax=Anabrus simplex TaxID=316456 RepID=UPI0034DD1097
MSGGSSNIMEEPQFIKCESEWLTSSGETSACGIGVLPPTDGQLVVNNDPQPYTYRFDEGFDVVTVKEDLNFNSAANNEVKDDLYETPVEDPLIDVIKESSAYVKNEIFIDEHADGQLEPDLKEEKWLRQVTVSVIFASC